MNSFKVTMLRNGDYLISNTATQEWGTYDEDGECLAGNLIMPGYTALAMIEDCYAGVDYAIV